MADQLLAAIKAQNFSSALKSLEADIEALKGRRVAAGIVSQLYYNKGFCNQKLKLQRKALKDFDESLAYDPKNVKALFRKGQVLFDLNRKQEATAAWKEAEALCDSSTDIELVMCIMSSLRDGTPGTIEEGAKAAAAANGVASTTPNGTSTSAAPTKAPATASPPASRPSSSKPQAASSSASDAASRSSSTAEDTETIDCAQQQQAASSRRRSVNLDPSSQDTINPAEMGNMLVNVAINSINAGQTAQAIRMLDQVLDKNPDNMSALIARGTANALEKKLKEAISDFSKAIDLQPSYPDTYKRRGVARSYEGDYEGALEDLGKYVELAPNFPDPTGQFKAGLAECRLERGMILQKMRNWRKAVEELKHATKLSPSNVQVWNMLGLCCTSMGDIDDGVAAYRKATQLDPKMKEAWINMAQALKEQGKVSEALAAFEEVLRLDERGKPSIAALRIMAQMHQGKGDHKGAIKLLNRAIDADPKDAQLVELYYYRAICYHALGDFKQAADDYTNCISVNFSDLPQEGRIFQCRAFYQKEIALWQFHLLDKDQSTFALDSELSDIFKENWCKKGPPPSELMARYRMQDPIPARLPPPPPAVDAVALRPVTELADRLGQLLQNHHQGFLPNVRQQRAAGYAALELAQAVLHVLEAKKLNNSVWINSEGATSQNGCSGRHVFGWRDAMDIVVKWRQLSEPNDEVVWVDLLTQREFNNGFGSHTPMFSGQTKCVRYYMNFDKALALMKKLLLAEGCAYDAHNRKVSLDAPDQVAALKKVKTAEDLYKIIKEDSWIVVPIDSSTRPNHHMEGTRLTLVKVPNQPDAYEFSIRTPVTPSRWKDFEKELEALWELMLGAMVEGDLPKAAKHIMEYGYYWYNFMPLARGTAAVGYTTILGLFWAGGMPITATIPKDYQVDWQAILAQEPDSFRLNVSTWFYPPAAHGRPTPEEHTALFPPPLKQPLVKELLPTMRARIEALNGVSNST